MKRIDDENWLDKQSYQRYELYFCPKCGREINEDLWRKGRYSCWGCKLTFLTPIVEVRRYKDAMDIVYTVESRTLSEPIRTAPWKPIFFGKDGVL